MLGPLLLALTVAAPTTDGGPPAQATAEVPAAAAPSAAKPTQPGEPPTWAERHPNQPEAAADGTVPERKSFVGELAYTAFILVIIVGLIYLLSRTGLERLSRFGASRDGKIIRVLERVQLDPRHSLFLVRLEGETMLLGGGERGVQLISKVDLPAEDTPNEEQPS